MGRLPILGRYLKRLFFAFEIVAPWPDDLPAGRVVAPSDRHMTLAFLGEVEEEPLLPDFPKPPFRQGLSGLFDKVLFLPHSDPRVAAWNVDWLEEKEPFFLYQKQISLWLKKKGITSKEHPGDFLPHVTLARSPFNPSEWKTTFKKLPLYANGLGLYESLGHSRYETLWLLPIQAPFVEVEHTADLAFRIRGSSLNQIHLHAALAMSFHFPPLLELIRKEPIFASLNGVVTNLNRMIAEMDVKRGCPFKAVSYHGDFQNSEWEMIVDV